MPWPTPMHIPPAPSGFPCVGGAKPTCEDACSGRAKRMPEGNCPPVRVDQFGVEVGHSADRRATEQRRLVQLHGADILHRFRHERGPARPQSRADAEIRRVDP